MGKAYKDYFLLNEVGTLKKIEKGNLEMRNTVTEMKNTLDAVPIHLDQSKKTEFRDTRLEDSQSELQRKKNTHSHWMSKEQEMNICVNLSQMYIWIIL